MHPVFGLVGPGPADLQQVAMAAEVYNSAAHRRSDDEVADVVFQAGGAATLAAEAARLAQTAAEALPVARSRRRRA